MSTPRSLDLISEARKLFAQGVTESIDHIIREAISRCIGDDWWVGELYGRCHTLNTIGTSYEVFMLDDRPILHLYKPSFARDNDNVTSEFKYRFIGDDIRTQPATTANSHKEIK